ncbi:hypothetical protein BAX97_17110 [Elizabethkingia meningoseptica]|nr:hypothetical protein BBD33_06660 [Elizabethkingia meningoseptica]EOR28384.1 hypothetical protein L100_16605 [Elizabethkingia meningoseptica ATCC 13253 = NBRC 12535]AQX46984.1 hypothetical protein B5G46_06650 [Elizabethkingia meningoseptica]KUY18039.1 hypothetical protein ATB99_07245 [Elizabethkingia meningoseptica]MDE5489038.1 hypothetical protein [Elizabethkingia meningoseptica]
MNYNKQIRKKNNMKPINQKIIKVINGIVLVSTISFGFLSCSSREDDKVTSGNNNGTALNLNITVADNGSGIAALASTSKNFAGNVLSNSLVSVAESKMVSAGGFDAIVSAETYKLGSGAVASVSDAGLAPVAVAQPMPVGIKYRFLLYDAAGTNLLQNVVGSSGTNPNIQVNAGQTYKWVAVSINDATTVPDLSAGTSKILSAGLSNKDILYASGTIVPVSGPNNLSVDFVHKTSRFVVSLDTRGMFGTINNTTTLEIGSGSGATFNSVLQSGDLDVLTGAFSNFQNIAAVAGSAMSNDAANGPATGATGAKIANFYTVNPVAIPANNLKIRVAPLNITMSDTSTRNFPTGVLSYTNTALTPAVGTSYSMTVRMVESGVVVKGITWARTNLYYDPAASQLDKYRFHPDNEYTIANVLNISLGGLLSLQLNGQAFNVTNEYWNWRATTPTGVVNAGDPCALVKPVGTWRMPTANEFTTLGQPNSDNTAAPLLLGGVRLASVWNLDAGQTANTSFPANSRSLFMPIFGYRDATGNTITDSPGSLLGGVVAAGTAHYWSSTASGPSNADYQRRPVTVIGGGLIHLFGAVTEVPAATNEGRNIRCVRS